MGIRYGYGYNTQTHTQNTQLFFGYSDEIYFYFIKNQFYLKKNVLTDYYYIIIIIIIFTQIKL